MKHVVVDPITRIEGHLRVEVQVDEGSGKVTDAISSGTAWRGLELVMKDRDPRDAWAYIQRICGVCTSAHALGSLRAVEDALGIKIPKNANYIRNIMAATLTVQDHIVHFYHLHALDWVSPVEALANWWDHPDYKLLPPEVHLMAIAHYLEMLDKHRDLVTPQVIFGGKNPHPHYCVGGMPCSISLEDGNAPVNTARLGIVDRAINLGRTLVNNFYIPDVLAIGAAYVKAGRVDGGGLAKERVLGYGSYPIEPFSGTSNGDFFKNLLIRTNGVVEDFGKGIDAAKVYEIDAEDITQPEVFTEGVEHSWYEYPANSDHDLNPWDGVTAPKFTAPKEGTPTDWKALNEQGKYSWLKTPKWRGKLCEVGPLARYIIIYTIRSTRYRRSSISHRKSGCRRWSAARLPAGLTASSTQRSTSSSSTSSSPTSSRATRRRPTWRNGIRRRGRRRPRASASTRLHVARSRTTSSSRTARRTTIRLSSRRPGMHARATTKPAMASTRRP